MSNFKRIVKTQLNFWKSHVQDAILGVGEATIARYSYSLLYLDTMTFSSSGSINLTRRESSEATDIVTLLGLSGGPKTTQTQKNKQ